MLQKEAELSRELFDRVVEVSGLSKVIAHAAVARACVRAGVDSSTLTRESLVKVLPHLEQTLWIYLPEEAPQRLRAIKALTQRPSWRPPAY
ncbi:MAG: hypothetical protein QM784_16275 [Polyangiaceae bacterium]